MINEINGIKYYTKLPGNAVLCNSVREFFRIKSGRTIWKKENVEAIPDIQFLIYSPTADKYFLRQTHECTTSKKLIKYIEDKNLDRLINVSDSLY